MGLVYTKLTFQNPVKPGIASMEVNSLVDTGSLHLCIPEYMAIQLELVELEKREVTIAHGSKKLCS
jgi:hypothetical protein